jgi:glutathione peroxidase
MMLRNTIMSLMAFMMLSGVTKAPAQQDSLEHRSVLDFTMKSIDGKNVPLSTYKGKVLLLVNVASKCGQTPQYAQLEELHKKYSGKGLAILGFPANNFGNQEPGTDEQIKEFCSTTYGVTFDMFSKISVKGDDQHPLYRYLTEKETNPGFAGDITWNFTKYLVDRDGAVVGKFASRVKPMSEEVIAAVEAALK